jgi:phosphoglycolate phosphatase-like HAD superfamily hydrolase
MPPTSVSWQAVFFDFDGVIADSTDVKIRAFSALFAADGPAVQQAVIRYHVDNGGMPRHEKIRHCFAVLAGHPLDETGLEQAGRTFSSLVLDEVVAAPLIPGALETLEKLRQSGIPAFVVSGTPGDEMRLIVERKGLASFFLEVHGSPQVKPAIVSEIFARHCYRPDRCLFVGDALADYRAAKANGLHFLGIVPTGQASIFPPEIPTSPTVTLAC